MRPEWVVNVDGPTRRVIEGDRGRPLLEAANPAHAVTWENIHQLVAERRILQPNDKQPFTSADELIDAEHNRLLVERLAMRKPSEGILGGEYIVYRAAPVEMLPWFARTQLPWGIAGMVVLALVAAALAAFDASASAIGATMTFDLHRRAGLGRRWLARRLGKPPATLDAADELQLARPLTLVLGAACTALAVAVAQFAQSPAALVGIASAAGAPLLGVFLLGMLTRRSTAAAAFVALVAGLVLGLGLAFQNDLATTWAIVGSSLLTFALGYVLSFLMGRRKPNQELRGLVAGCGMLGLRAVDEVAPRIALPAPDTGEGAGVRWK
jgi:hypothetical protein